MLAVVVRSNSLCRRLTVVVAGGQRDRAAFADEDGADLVGYEQLDEDAAAAAKHAAKKTSSGRKKKSKKQRR